jgi:hypothetical protein
MYTIFKRLVIFIIVYNFHQMASSRFPNNSMARPRRERSSHSHIPGHRVHGTGSGSLPLGPTINMIGH